jgi:hypothetical protein
MTSSTRRLVRTAVIALCATGACSTALAVQASAATITPDAACYVNLDPALGAAMTITGSGFNPSAPVELTAAGSEIGSGTADAAGHVSIATNAPLLSTTGPGSIATTLTATGQPTSGTPATATTVVRSANLSISVKPLSVHNVRKDKVTFRFSGFTPGKRIYGYYGYKKKIVAKATFARAGGPCGTLTQKALLYPGGRPAHDAFKVTFESTSRYDKSAIPRVTGNLSVFHF